MHNRDYSSPIVTNCTFSGNTAKDDGGCMASYDYSSPTVTNCIMWGDSAPNGSEIYNDSISSTTVTYTDVEGGYGGDGNKNEAPLFVVGSGNYHLQAVSPCIDAGDNDAVPADTADLDLDGDTDEPVPFDLDGNPRFVDDPDTIDTGNGTPPIVDMGAYEYQIP